MYMYMYVHVYPFISLEFFLTKNIFDKIYNYSKFI